MKQWHLKKGKELRLRQGHPWVYRHELLESGTDVKPGEPLEIVDARGNFVASGYGSPVSQIAFRAVSWRKGEVWATPEVWIERVRQAIRRRWQAGYRDSARWVFSEADGLPGLILDRYRLASPPESSGRGGSGGAGQVLSAQVLTAGMSVWAGDLEKNLREALKELPEIGGDWETTSLVDRRDAKVRGKEGLTVEAPTILKGNSGDRWVWVSSALPGAGPWRLEADLLNGQKTGFFLDQSHNMRLLISALQRRERFLGASKVRVLDLCSYVGHWSLQIGEALRTWKSGMEAHLVDVSAAALQRAQRNLQASGFDAVALECDVMKETSQIPEGPFDIVIVDPPAFAKSQRDVEVAKAAYEKLNIEAFRRTRPGALVVSCSCSGLVTREDFLGAVGSALRRSGRQGRVVASGQAGEDHPMLPWFPEGSYLKMILTEIY